MIEIGRVYLDTNIIINLLEGPSEFSQAISQVLAYGFGHERFVTSDLSFAEAMVGPLRNKDYQLLSQYSLFSASSRLWEVAAIDKSVLYSAALLRADHRALKLPDAIHLASAFSRGCSHFLSDDDRLTSSYALAGDVPGISMERREIHVLRPNGDDLARLIKAMRP